MLKQEEERKTEDDVIWGEPGLSLLDSGC